ncbi:MAG TPA: LapA family protein [Pseudolabrys sp.]|nr:LapA family protein [Pseudolabrys sp.]
MFRKILTWIIVVPLAIIIVAFAVANRQVVTVSFDPLSSTSPALSASLPLFILIFVLVILGVIVGGVAAWLRQGKWRRAARKLDAENRHLLQELAAIRNRFAPEAPAALVAEPEPKPAAMPVLPPPVG